MCKAFERIEASYSATIMEKVLVVADKIAKQKSFENFQIDSEIEKTCEELTEKFIHWNDDEFPELYENFISAHENEIQI